MPWELLVGLGLPGVALGIFVLLAQGENSFWQTMPKTWRGPVAALFVTFVFLITFFIVAPRGSNSIVGDCGGIGSSISIDCRGRK